MQLTTPIKTVDFTKKIKYSDQIISLGSCFSVHITQKLAQLGYNTLQNPTGISYNAASIDRTIKMVCNPDSLLHTPINYQQGLYSHPDFHGSYNKVDKKELEKSLLKSLEKANHFLQNASRVMITLGTSIVFKCTTTGEIVNNCHKRPADLFKKEELTILTTANLLTNTIRQIESHSQVEQVDFIFTLSPVRHIKNGLVVDGRSKAIALLAIHEVVAQLPNCHYFPAYEIQNDELRDYRFYASDLIHPSQTSIDLIYNRFSDSLLDPGEKVLRKKVHSIQQRRQHRPLFAETAEHQKFKTQLEQDIAELKACHPFLQLY